MVIDPRYFRPTEVEFLLGDPTKAKNKLGWQPDYVFLAAAKVGGIHANNEYPAEFIYDNLIIEANVIHQAWVAGVRQLLFLGSSCIYPRLAEQPMREDALLTGPLESTNEPYAIAKIAGIKLCESYNRQYGTDYRSVMPTNLYGENDNFHAVNSHVIPGMMRRFHEAKIKNRSQIELWGTGRAKREFLHVDDMAAACVHVLGIEADVYRERTRPMRSHINVGTGQDITIRELAETIAEVVGYDGKITWNAAMPDGTPRKLLDVGLLQSRGWKAKISLRDGLNLCLVSGARRQFQKIKAARSTPEHTANSDTLGTLRLLEAIRILGLEQMRVKKLRCQVSIFDIIQLCRDILVNLLLCIESRLLPL